MSQSPPHVLHYKVHDDIRRLLENIYLKKIGRNNEKLNNQAQNLISEVFDGRQQQIKQAHITQLKERLDSLCSSQINEQSPPRYSPQLQLQIKEKKIENNQIMKLPKLFQHRDAQYQDQQQQYGSQLSSRLDHQNNKSQRSQSPQFPPNIINQRESILRAYCNDYISSTPRNQDKKDNLFYDRNTSYDSSINRHQISTNTSRRKVKHQDYPSKHPPQYYQQTEEKYKLNPQVISSINSTPTRSNMKVIQFKVQLDARNKQQSNIDHRNSTEQEDNQNNYNNKRYNKVLFLSSQKGEAPEQQNNIKRRNTNSQAYINEFIDTPQQTCASIKNTNEVGDSKAKNELLKENKYDRYVQRINRKEFIKNTNQQPKAKQVDIFKEESQPIDYFYSQNIPNTLKINNKKNNGQERSSSQNSYLKEQNAQVVQRIMNPNNNYQYKQKSHLNNSMIVIQDESPIRNSMKQSLQFMPAKENAFIKEVKSTQEYLKEHNNDIWTLIAKFNIQKELDKKRKAQQQQQQQINNMRHELDHQINEKSGNAKTQMIIDQEYSQVIKRQIEKQNELQDNEKFEVNQKKKQQAHLLDEQMMEREEERKKTRRQIEQDNQELINNLKKQQLEEDQSKINQQKKNKQLYEGIKQDYFERFKRVSPEELNEDHKLVNEKKRIVNYAKELDGQKQNTSNQYHPIEKFVQREKIKPIDEDILKDWAEQIKEKQKIYNNDREQEKKDLESCLQQCEQDEKQELKKNIEHKVKVIINQQQIKDQVQQKKSAKVPAASGFDIQNNLSILREIDDYIYKSQVIED